MSLFKVPRAIRLRPVAPPKSRRQRCALPSENDYAYIGPDTRRFVWARDGGRCRHCATDQDLQFDHIIPRSRGGSGVAANVELLCRTCNQRKSARLATPK
jgi:5-methylcytosine-specific restriction endonuclease McrA